MIRLLPKREYICPFCHEVMIAFSWARTKSNIIRGSCKCGKGVWYHNEDKTWSFLTKDGWGTPVDIPVRFNPSSR